MSKQRAAKWQGTGWVNLEEGATRGATLGVDVYAPDGSVLTLAQLIALAAGAASDEPAALVPWRSLIDVPSNVQEVEALATSGLVVRQVAGDWVTRTLQPTAGETTVANGAGEAGDPSVGLADVADAGGGALLRTAFDAKGRKTGSSAATTADLAEGSNLYFTAGRVQATALASFTVATLPAQAAGLMIFVTDEVGGAVPAFSDGTDWRRVTDRAIVS